MLTKKSRFNLLLSVAILFIPSVLAFAEEPVPATFEASNPQAPNGYSASSAIAQGSESIDPYGGSLSLINEDLRIAGPGGHDLVITRYYQNLQNAATDRQYKGSNGGIGALGPGWDMNFGRVWPYSDNNGIHELVPFDDRSRNECVSGNNDIAVMSKHPVLELSDGSKHQFFNPYRVDFSYRSKSNHFAYCIPTGLPDLNQTESAGALYQQGGLIVVAADGKKYTFNDRGRVIDTHATSDAERNAAYAYLATEIEDAAGNKTIITYGNRTITTAGKTGANSVVLRVPITVSVENGPSVTLTYNEFGLTGIEGQNINYTISDDVNDSAIENVLTKVELPESHEWNYTYYNEVAAGGSYSIQTTENPGGMVTTYLYDEGKTNSMALALHCGGWSGENCETVVVVDKTTSGGGTDNTHWTYEYERANIGDHDVTKITHLGYSCSEYKYEGVNYHPPEYISSNVPNIHRRGLLVERALYSGSCDGALVETEVYTYPDTGGSKLELSAHARDFQTAPQSMGPFGIYQSLMTEKVLTRNNGGGTYTTTYGGFSWLGNPTTITESGPNGSRTITRDYWEGFLSGSDHNFFYNNRVTTETISDNGETFRRKWGYAFGYLKLMLEENNGVITTYGYDDKANLTSTIKGKYIDEDGGGFTLTEGGFIDTAVLTARLDANWSYFAEDFQSNGKPQRIKLMHRIASGFGGYSVVNIDKTYDDRGNPEAEDWTLAGAGAPYKSIAYSYDDLDRITSVETARTDDSDLSMAYSAGSGYTASTTRGNLTTEKNYNATGALLYSTVTGGGASIHTAYNVDELNRTTYATNPSDSALVGSADSYDGTKTAYDDLNRVTGVTHWVGGGINGSIDSSIDYGYSDGQVAITDEGDYTTTQTFQSFSPSEKHLISIEQQTGGGSIVTDIDRNVVGRINSITQSDGVTAGITHEFKYFSNLPMRVEKENRPETGWLKYERNATGQVTKKEICPDVGCASATSETDYYYDQSGRVRLIDYPDDTKDAFNLYDALGRLVYAWILEPDAKDVWETSCIDSVSGVLWENCHEADKLGETTLSFGRWSYGYDLNDNLTAEIFDRYVGYEIILGQTFHEVDQKLISYDYDAKDNLEKITYPNTDYVEYAPDALGRPTKVKLTNVADGGGVVNLVDNGSLNWHPNGQLSGYGIGTNTLSVGMTQNARLRPEDLTVSGNILSLSYDYDTRGNITGITDDKGLGDRSGFVYDGVSRLKTVVLQGLGTHNYTYNALGDIATKTAPGVTHTYSYNGNNQLNAITGLSDYGSFAYDEYGNTTDIGGKTFIYDDASNLIEADVNETESELYSYDAHKRRYKITKGDGSEYYPLYNLSGQLMVDIDEGENLYPLDQTVSYENQRNYIYLNGAMIAQDDSCDDENTNNAMGICFWVDEDGDGLNWEEEQDAGTDEHNADSDNDGLNDFDEINVTMTDPNNEDHDGDGFLDGWEYDSVSSGFNPDGDDSAKADLDTDGDGLKSTQEHANGTDPGKWDSDDDLMSDGWEVLYGLNPLDPTDASGDLDEDTVNNLDEYNNGANPTASDSDSDGLLDAWEFQYGYDFSVTSGDDGAAEDDLPDEDGLITIDEQFNDTDPTDSDSDDDDMPDGWEVDHGLDPNDSSDRDEDWDSDTLTNVDECSFGIDPEDSKEKCLLDTDPNLADSDYDLLLDAWEVLYENAGFDPTEFDSPGVGVLGAEDPDDEYVDDDDGASDDDRDGLSAIDEQRYGTDPSKADTDMDTLLDGLEIAAGRDPLVKDYEIFNDGYLCVTDDSANGFTCFDDTGTFDSIAETVTLDNPVKISTSNSPGMGHGCALSEDGVIECWGNDFFSQVSTVPVGAYKDVKASGGIPNPWSAQFSFPDRPASTCVINLLNQLECFGDKDATYGMPISHWYFDSETIKQLDMSVDVACGIGSNDNVYCWGSAWVGTQFYFGGFGSSITPDGGHSAVKVEVGSYVSIKDDVFGNQGWSTETRVPHACLLSDGNQIQCWDANGSLGVPALSNPIDLFVGGGFACALDDSGLKCWGYSSNTAVPYTSLPPVEWSNPVLVNPVQYSAGDQGTMCALDDSGIVCWDETGFLSSESKANAELDWDHDLDGLTWSEEDDDKRFDFNDLDGDGLGDGIEADLGTNPNLKDTDDDKVEDGLEIATGTDPLDVADFVEFTTNIVTYQDSFSLDAAFLLTEDFGLSGDVSVDSVSSIEGFTQGDVTLDDDGQFTYTYNPLIFPAVFEDKVLYSLSNGTKVFLSLSLRTIGANLMGTDDNEIAVANGDGLSTDVLSGDDIIIDGLGDDNVIFKSFYGDDIVYFVDSNSVTGTVNSIDFRGDLAITGSLITADDLSVVQDNGNLVFTLPNDEGSITVLNWTNSPKNKVDEILFNGVNAQDTIVTDDKIIVANQGGETISIGVEPLLFSDYSSEPGISFRVKEDELLSEVQGNISGDPVYANNWGLESITLDPDDKSEPMVFSYRVSDSYPTTDGFPVENEDTGTVEVTIDMDSDGCNFNSLPVTTCLEGVVNAGSEHIVGFGATVFKGNDGDDVIWPEGDVQNFIVIGENDGNDIINLFGNGNDATADILYFPDVIDPDNIDFSRDGLDLLVSVNGDSDEIRLKLFYASSQTVLSLLEADDGLVLFSEIRYGVENGDNVIARGDMIDGGNSNMMPGQVKGTDEDDIIRVDDVNAVLYGDGGDDTLRSYGGTNYLNGGGGVDTYEISLHSGHTTIDNWDYSTGDIAYEDENEDDINDNPNDNILVGYTGNNTDNVILGRENLDLTISIVHGSNSEWTSFTRVLNFFEESFGNPNEIDIVLSDQFWDGDCVDIQSEHSIPWGASVTGECIRKLVLEHAIADDTCDNPAVDDDHLRGYSNESTGQNIAVGVNDVIHGGCGNDIIAGRHGDDTLYGDEGEDILYGEIDNDTLYGGPDNDELYAGNQDYWGWGTDDFLYGDGGDDHFYGLKWALNTTTMTGGEGDDTYHVNGHGKTIIDDIDIDAGGGQDTLIFEDDTVAETLWFYVSGDDLIIKDIGNGVKVIVSNWDQGNNELSFINMTAGDCDTLTRDNLVSLVGAMLSETGGSQEVAFTRDFIDDYWSGTNCVAQ